MYHEGRFFGFLKTKSLFPYIIETNLLRDMSGTMAVRPFPDGRIRGFEGKGMYAERNREWVVAVLGGGFLCGIACGVRLDL
jgi:hypothetical protein